LHYCAPLLCSLFSSRLSWVARSIRQMRLLQGVVMDLVSRLSSPCYSLNFPDLQSRNSVVLIAQSANPMNTRRCPAYALTLIALSPRTLAEIATLGSTPPSPSPLARQHSLQCMPWTTAAGKLHGLYKWKALTCQMQIQPRKRFESFGRHY
jgi:hypothetical protein